MKTYGTVRLDENIWKVSCEPFVTIGLKRVFARVSKSEHRTISLANTPENCRNLKWFLERYPMVVEDAAALDRSASEFDRRIALVADIVSGNQSSLRSRRAIINAFPPHSCSRTGACFVRTNSVSGKSSKRSS